MLNQIGPEELSIFDITISTNNSAESYHSKLKGIVKTSHPRIWTLITTLNEIIEDVDNDFGRLRQGREITRERKKKDVKNEELRVISKVKLREGVYSPLQFLESISFTIGNIRAPENLALSDTEYSQMRKITHILIRTTAVYSACHREQGRGYSCLANMLISALIAAIQLRN